jgi:hypothetical protein
MEFLSGFLEDLIAADAYRILNEVKIGVRITPYPLVEKVVRVMVEHSINRGFRSFVR